MQVWSRTRGGGGGGGGGLNDEPRKGRGVELEGGEGGGARLSPQE